MNKIQETVYQHFVLNGMTEVNAKLELGEMSELEIEKLHTKIKKETEIMEKTTTTKGKKTNPAIPSKTVKPVKAETVKPEAKKTDVKKIPVKPAKAVTDKRTGDDRRQEIKPVTGKTSKPDAVKPATLKPVKQEKVISKEKQAAKDKLAAKVKPAKKAAKYSRSHALVDALKKGGTKEMMVKYADELYTSKNDVVHSTGACPVAEKLLSYVLPSLLLAGFVVKDEKGKYHIVK